MKLYITALAYHSMLRNSLVTDVNWHLNGGNLLGFSELEIIEDINFISDGELISYAKVGDYILITDNYSAINAARLQTVKSERVVDKECSAIDFLFFSMKVSGDL